MKKKLVFFAISVIYGFTHIHAQWAGPSGNPGTMATGNNVRIGGWGTPVSSTLQIGDGTGDLHWPISPARNGLLIKFSSGDRALLELHDPSGANRTIFQSLANITYLTTVGAQPMVMQVNNNSRVGIGTISPNNQAKTHIDFTATTPGQGLEYYGLLSTIRSSGPVLQGAAIHSIIGVKGQADAAYVPNYNQGNPVNEFSYGVVGTSNRGFWNVGGFFSATGEGGPFGNVGIYATAATTPFSAQNFAGFFAGNVYCTGSYLPSDEKLKTDLKPMEKTLEKISQLRPGAYYYKKDEYKGMQLPGQVQYGFTAQNIEAVFPSLVTEVAAVKTSIDKNNSVDIPGHKAINYTALIPVLIAGMQEQQQQIEQLQAQVAALSGGRVAPVAPAAADKSAVLLNQNVPNPFAESTLISFNIPEQTKLAQLQITTLDGKPVKTVRLNQTGAGTIRVYGVDLGSGLYMYSLIADGKVLETKKMVKE